MYEQITVQTDTWMPGQHMDEPPDAPGDIWPYEYTDGHMDGHTDIPMEAQMHAKEPSLCLPKKAKSMHLFLHLM